MDGKVNIRILKLEEIKSALEKMGEQIFRGAQIFEWLWKKNAQSFEEMTNLSKSLRDKLNMSFFIDNIELKDQQISIDKTIKCGQ